MTPGDISINDYSASGFLGAGGEQGAMDLFKAMQAGSITGRETTNLPLTGEPLKAESLEKTLKLLEFRQQDIKLLNAMPKMTAYNTVEEFLQLSSYGSNRGGFYSEGEISDTEDSTYIRRSELIKYLQVTGEITMQAQMTRNYVDVAKKEIENKVMWVTRRANEALTKANSSVVSQEWNSIYTQLASIGSGLLYSSIEDYYTSATVIDLRGASLKQEDVEKGAVIVDSNYGNVSHLFAPTKVLSTLSQDYFQDQRIMLNANSESSYNGTIGTVAKQIDTTIGSVALMADKFMSQNSEKEIMTTASVATSDKAPAVVTGLTATLASDTVSKIQAGETGTTYYAVAARNRYGISALTVYATPITLAADKAVDLTFTAGANATGFVIFRSVITSASLDASIKFYPIFEVSASQKTSGHDGGAAGVVRDRIRFLPNTETAFITEMVDEVMSFKQLAPISKLDLAVLALSRRFITFMFATPQVYAPKKVVKYINCATTLTA